MQKTKNICAAIKSLWKFWSGSNAKRASQERRYTHAYVIFGNVRGLTPSHAMLKQGFRHLGVAFDRKDGVLLCECTFSRLVISESRCRSMDSFIDNYKEKGYRILKGKTKASKNITNHVPYSIAPFNCVTMCKALLGVKIARCWTPYQLFCKLQTKYNFEEI